MSSEYQALESWFQTVFHSNTGHSGLVFEPLLNRTEIKRIVLKPDPCVRYENDTPIWTGPLCSVWEWYAHLIIRCFIQVCMNIHKESKYYSIKIRSHSYSNPLVHDVINECPFYFRHFKHSSLTSTAEAQFERASYENQVILIFKLTGNNFILNFWLYSGDLNNRYSNKTNKWIQWGSK